MISRPEPVIIQGGMGAAVSSWPLARVVSQMGQLGVVSGTALDCVVCRRLQLGDPDGALRRAMSAFPYPEMIPPILDRYFISGGKAPEEQFVSCPMPSANPSQRQLELLVVSNFVEVYLAKEEHAGLVGINYLEKIQVPTLASLYGAMLASVDYVLMGAGIPRAIPGILDRLSQCEPVEMPLNVIGADRDDHFVTQFDPNEFAQNEGPSLKRPKFLAIVSSQTLAAMLVKKSTGRVDGFVVEGPTAGGHNAPPRGTMQLNDRGEPIYGDRDVPDMEAFRSLGLPFWLAGSYGTPQRVTEALAMGATGVQVGTAFAFCEESGLRADVKQQVLDMVRAGTADVRTEPRVSPAGFPFKVLGLPSSTPAENSIGERTRVCDLGFLRQAYKKPDGMLGWRCPAEEIKAYVRKGGDEADTQGRKCVCHGLMANIDMEQGKPGSVAEQPLVTTGNDVHSITNFLRTPADNSYSARDVVEQLLTGIPTSGSVNKIA